MGRPRKEKTCEGCGKSFMPNSGVQRFCKECRPSKPKKLRRAAPQKAKPLKRRPPARRVNEEIRSRVAGHLDGRLQRINAESFERFRDAR